MRPLQKVVKEDGSRGRWGPKETSHTKRNCGPLCITKSGHQACVPGVWWGLLPCHIECLVCSKCTTNIHELLNELGHE